MKITAEETRAKNRTPLPIFPTSRIKEIEVYVPAKFKSRIGNVRVRQGYEDLIVVKFV